MSDDLKKRLKDALIEGETHKELENLASEALSTLDARDREVARLRKALAEEREDNLWNAYHEGVERDGRWSHAYKSEPEQLVRACGYDPKEAWYDAQTIQNMIPKIARTALANEETDDEG